MKQHYRNILTSALTSALTVAVILSAVLHTPTFGTQVALTDNLNTFRLAFNALEASTLSTTTPLSAGQLVYATGVNTIGSVATSTLTISGPFILPTIRVIGSSGAITYTGLATTSQPSSSNLLVSNGAAGVFGVATTSVSCSGSVSCTSFTAIGASPITISGSGGASWPFTPTTYSGTAVQSTSTPLWLKATSPYSLVASSTFATYASTTVLTASSRAYVGNSLDFNGSTLSSTPLSGDGMWKFTNGIVFDTGASRSVYFNAAGTTQLTVGTSAISTRAGELFGIGSSTPRWAFSVNDTGSDFYIDSTGKIIGRDTTNNWPGRITPTRFPPLQTGTTTTWTGTTTDAWVPYYPMPFVGSLRAARCMATSTQAFLGVQVYINQTPVTPFFIASNTTGVITFTANNTFSTGDILSMYVGTSTASAANKSVSCLFSTTETP